MAETSRTLEIIVKAKDLFTRQFGTVGRAFISSIRSTWNAGFKLLAGGFNVVKRAMFNMGTAFLGLFAASRVAAFTNATIEEADHLHKLAVALGSTTERLSELKAAFEFSGIGADFEKTIKGLSRALSQIFTKGPDARQGDALRSLGISLNELRDADPLDMLQGIAKGLERYSSEAEKAAVLSAIFGQSFDTKLLVLLGRGEAEFLKNTDAAKRFGATLRGDLAAAAEAAGDQIGYIKLQFGSAFRDAVLGVAKALVPVLERFNEMMTLARPGLVSALQAVLFVGIRLGFWLTDTFLAAVQWGTVVLDSFKRVLYEVAVAMNFITEALTLTFVTMFSEKTLSFLRPLSDDAANTRDRMAEVAVKLQQVREKIEQVKAVGSIEMGLGEDQAAALAALDQQVVQWTNMLENLADSFAASTGDEFSRAAEIARATSFAQIQAMRDRIEQLRQMSSEAEVAARSTAKVTAEVGRLAGTIEKSQETVDGFWTRFVKGAQDSAVSYTKFLDTVQSSTTAVIESLGGRIEDMFVDWLTGVESFKDAFKSLTKSIIADLIRWIVKLTLLWIWQQLTGTGAAADAPIAGTSAAPDFLSGSASFADGGVTSGMKVLRQQAHHSMPIRRFADGGVATKPTIGVFGEAGAEAFVPLKGGRIPVTMRGNSSSTTNITFNVNATDAKGVRQMLIDERATILAVMNNGLQSQRQIRTTVTGV